MSIERDAAEAMRAKVFAKVFGALARWEDKIKHSVQPESILYRLGYGQPARAALELADLYRYRARVYGLLAEELDGVGDTDGPAPALHLTVVQGLTPPQPGASVNVCWCEIGVTTTWLASVARDEDAAGTPVWAVHENGNAAVRRHATWEAARSDALTRGLARYTTMVTRAS
jgi:hypothetical protein